MGNQYLTDKQLAARFGVGRATIWRWAKETDFPAPIKLGLAVTRWRLVDVEAWEDAKGGAAA